MWLLTSIVNLMRHTVTWEKGFESFSQCVELFPGLGFWSVYKRTEQIFIVLCSCFLDFHTFMDWTLKLCTITNPSFLKLLLLGYIITGTKTVAKIVKYKTRNITIERESYEQVNAHKSNTYLFRMNTWLQQSCMDKTDKCKCYPSVSRIAQWVGKHWAWA